MYRFLVFAMAVGVGIVALAVAVAQPPSDPLTNAVTAQRTAYYAAPPVARPSPYYSPRLAMNQPVTAYPQGTGTTPRGTYLPPSAYGPNYGGMPARVAQAPAQAPRPAAPAPAPAPVPAGPYNGSAASGAPYGDDGYSGYDGCSSCGSRRGCVGHGGRWGYDMPQHYPYYPPMHGYYYFYPYHYTHVPAQQAFTSQFGVDARNPYSNDFFKVVYAEYKASLLRPSEEPIGTPLPESPADTIKKLKALNDEGILSQEEFEAKKTEILQRM